MFTHLRRMFFVALAIAIGSGVVADELKSPTGLIVLRVSGAIEHTNQNGAAEFDRDMLVDLDWRAIESFTTWTEGPQQFSGTPLAALLEAVGADGELIVATALNDYSVKIPLSDAADFDMLLAMEIDGVQMRIRDKGPIWIIYPQTEEQSDERHHDEKMIWQLKSLEITEKSEK